MTADLTAAPAPAGPEALPRAEARQETRQETRQEARQGVLAVLPILLGYAPFALVIGATIANHPEPLAGWVATGLIYGGSAQLAVLAATGTGSGLVIAVLAGLLINSRLAVYAATLGPHWRTERRGFRALAAALLIDPSWTVGLARYQRPGTPAGKRGYYLAAGATMWTGWLLMITIAATAGKRFEVPLDPRMVVGLCLLALLAPGLRTRGGWTGAGAAAGATVAGLLWLPGDTGLIMATLAGLAAGLHADRRGRR